MAKRVQQKPRRRVGLKEMGRRGLSLLMAMIMVISLIQISAFATGTNAVTEQAEKQIEGGTTPVYYTYNAETGAFGTDTTTDALVQSPGGKVEISKTIAATGEENLFDITLNVKTKQEITQSTASPDAAVVLVLDVSGSMGYCANCGSNDWNYSTHYYCKNGSGNEYYDKDWDGDLYCEYCGALRFQHEKRYILDDCDECGGTQTRLDAAKATAAQFLEKFAASASGEAKREVAVVTFSSGANAMNFGNGTYWLDVAKQENLTTVVNQINGLSDDGGTNIDGGLRVAYSLLTQDTTAAMDYRNVILLTDGEPTYCVADSGFNGSAQLSYGGSDWDVHGMGNKACQKTVGYAERVASAIRNLAANTEDKTKVQLFSVYYGKAGDTMNVYREGGWGTHPSVAERNKNISNWLGSISTRDAFTAENAEDLNSSFDAIIKIIEMQTKAWTVTDKMGDRIQFVSGANVDGENQAKIYDSKSNSIVWRLPMDVPTIDGEWHTYTMTYRVRLNNVGDDFDTQKNYLTNGETKLEYSFFATQTINGVEQKGPTDEEGKFVYDQNGNVNPGMESWTKNQVLYFKVPAVKGYQADLSFTKIGSDTQAGLMGAQFTLADNSDAIAWTDSTASGNDGQVAFANIPSGYTYTLTETEAPKNYNKVDPITVTVKYGKLTADSTAEGGANITNGKLEDPSKQTYTDVTITKTWQKPAGEATPDSIIVTLKQDGTAMTEYTDFEIQKSDCTIDENGVWSYTFKNLPDSKPDGGTYKYTVEEKTMDGWNTSYGDDSLSIVNTASGTTSVVVAKFWTLPEGMSADDQTVEVTLTRDGQKLTGDEYTKTITGNGMVKFENLPKYNENGQLYQYGAEEASGNYQQAKPATSDGYTITFYNTVAVEKTSISGVKTWNDGGDTASRPKEITVALYKDDGTEPFATTTASAATDWAYSFDNLDRYEFTWDENDNNNNNIIAVREIKYTVKEVGVDGYTATISGNNITNTRTGSIDLIVNKAWVAQGDHPADVTVQLYANGVAFGEPVVFTDSYTFKGLSKYDASGEEIKYSVVETPVSGYTTSYGKMELLSEDVYAITVTNTQNGFDPDDEVLITVTKTWQQPSTVEAQTADFYLCIDGNRSDYSVSITGNGSTSFAPMPRYHAVRDEATGETEYVEINYSVEEDVPSNYTVFVDEVVGPDSNGNIYYHFTNTIRGTTSLSLEKTWVQPDGMDTPMATFEIQRSVDGTNWENAGYITLMDGKTSETRNNLDKYDANGQLYLYRVVENSVAGYSSIMTGGIQEDGSFAFQATNTINQATADITVSKTWIDGNTPNSQRPDVTIDLLQDGVVINSVTFGWSEADGAVMATVNGASIKATVSEDGNTWSIKFMGQPLYNENRTARYEYSVQEQNVPENYKANVSGTTVTNQLTGTISIPVTKYWVDPGVADRPDITLRLKGSDGSEYVMLVSDDSGAPVVTLNGVSLPITAEGNTWTFTVGNLPEYTDTGAKITYTLSEDAVDGYTTQTVEGQPFAIKNVIEQENGITITPVKFWENMDVEGVYTPVLPETITVALFRDGAMVDGTKQTVSVGEDGTCEFKPYEELAKYNLTTGQKYKYEVLELDAKGSPVKNGETISFGTDNDYTVTYREMEVDTGDNYQVVITNTFTVPAKYLWVVKTHYVHYDYNGNVIGSFNDQTEIFKETESKTVSANPADYTVRDGLTYEYDADNTGNKTQVLLEQQNYLYELNLYYTLTDEEPTDPGDGGGGGTTYYNLVVKYLEEGTDEVLASPYTVRIAAGRSYDVTAQTQKAIDGYEISQVTGDDVTGYMNGNREIIVYYTVDIDDGETPLDPGPGGDGDGDGTDIGDGEVPLDPGPGGDGDGTDIGDENVPLVPATGDNLALWVMAAVASAAGLVYLTVAGKKREKDNT